MSGKFSKLQQAIGEYFIFFTKSLDLKTLVAKPLVFVYLGGKAMANLASVPSQ